MANNLEMCATPDQFFDASKITIQNHLIKSNLLPKRAQPALGNLVATRMHMLADEEFISEANRSVSSHADPNNPITSEQVAEGGMTYAPGIITGEEPKIIVGRSMIERNIDRPYFLLGCMLEEVAHAYSPPLLYTPLLRIPEGSYKLAPYDTYDEVEEYLKSKKRLVSDTDNGVNLENVTAITSGFSTVMQESDTSPTESFTYSPTLDQRALEEARAVLVQALFAAKVHGAIKKPYGSLQEQLFVGFGDFLKKGSDNLHPNQFMGGTIVINYIDSEPNPARAAQELVKNLYEMDVDRFLEYLSRRKTKIFDEFMGIVQLYKDEASY